MRLPFTDTQEEDFLNEENIIQLGYPPNRIDIINQIDSVAFKDAFENREVFKNEQMVMNFIGIEQLIQNKKASGRLQDLADLEILEKIKKEANRKEK
ncbi:MAG: hypothetical protein AAF990_13165 [Bacteroidota bacterium]